MNFKNHKYALPLVVIVSVCFSWLYYFLYLHYLRTTTFGLLSLLIVSVIAWTSGTVPALLCALLNITGMAFTIRNLTPEISASTSADAFISIGGHLLAAFSGGYFGGLSKRLGNEIEERKKAEDLLKIYQNQLEERVKTRTHELEIANEKLHQAEKMEAIGQLAGGIAHDFRNHLTITQGYANLLTKKCDPDSQEYKYAEQIHISAKRASELTSQLLAFARREKYQPELIDCNNLINEVISLIPQSVKHTVTITSNLGTDIPSVLGGFSQIHNAILNIALNACDAMEKGGTLTLSTEVTEVTENYRRKHSITCITGRYVGIVISDTGTGIPPDVLPHIFEPFFTTKEKGKGTGMGLAAVFGIAQSHGGTIFVESTPGKGTTFTLLLPGIK